MSDWLPISTAPTDGTEIQARGFNWGDRTRGRHRVKAFHRNGKWIDADDEDSTLHYLDEWKPLPSPTSPDVRTYADGGEG